MKLKKMEITGFKSFSDKVSIEFPLGVSGIVGPNGCGKSNIVDALRWAMGEQSVKQLRGKAMEDVIFAGTDGRQPLNMAEVSLLLENDNGSAPEEYKDFSEIMITRRLYRSGESGYLINKQPSRLKDITNLFLGSGMGAKSYAVIQQGNIGAITEAGPEERRFFIEEAAGITRYRQRKTEALRKVDATNQNLLRVKDIIAEVERQMNSLKRQARKAERYKNYRERIRKLDIRLSLHYYEEHTRQIEESGTLLKNLRDADIQHISQIKQLDAAVEDIKLRRWQKNQEISEQKSRKFNMRRDIDRMENDLGHLRKDVERLAGEAVELRSAHKELEEKNENMVSEVAEAEEQNLVLKRKIEEAIVNISRERQDSEKIRTELSALNQKLEDAKNSLMELVAQEAKYRNIRENAANNRDSLKRRLKRIDEEEVITGRKVKECEGRGSQAEEELELCRQEIGELEKDIEGIREQLTEKTTALASQVKLVQSLELERGKAKSKYSALKKMEDNFEWYKGGVRAIMKMGDDSSPDASPSGFSRQSVMGLTADIIEPEPAFETAVEAVLGDSLQYILVKDREAGIDAIHYLQEQAAGRGGFIPMSSLKPLGENGNSEFEIRNTARLLDHVTVKEGFEHIAEVLLGHVMFAENMESAMNLYDNNGGYRTFVTGDGDVISFQGMMIGGSRDNLSGILSKKQELKELQEQVSSLEEKLESAHKEQKSLESEVRTIESDLQKAIEQKNKLAQDEMDAEKLLYKITEELKHARRHLEVVRSEQEQLMDEESGIDDEIDKYAKVLAQVESEIRAAQTSVAETSEKITAVSSDLRIADQQIVDLKLQQTSFNAQLENSTNSLRRLRQFREDGIIRLEQLSKDILLKERKRDDSKTKIGSHEEKLSRMYEDIKTLEDTLETNEADFQAIDEILKQNDNSISDIKNRREEALQNIRVIELEQSQQQIRRENIANQLEERYHSPFSEIQTEADASRDEGDASTPPEEMEADLARFRKKIAGIGDVNLGAIEEYEQHKERFNFLNAQQEDLLKAIDDLHKVIRKINRITQERFLETFRQVNEKLNEVFPRLFDGGTAKLVLTDPSKPLETGVEFMVHPPGKKLTRLSLLSGGEKALSAIAFIFSIFLIKPASFCIMDEIDAPLDEANVFRFNELLKIIGEKSQIIMITHKKKSMEFADTLFGVTMEKKGISKIVSVNFGKTAGEQSGG